MFVGFYCSLGLMNFQKWELFSGSPGISNESARQNKSNGVHKFMIRISCAKLASFLSFSL